jgi:hypothetical protein
MRDVARQQQPSLDRLPAIAAKGHIERLNRRKPRIVRLKMHIERMHARFLERRLPECIEIGRFFTRGKVPL